MFKKICIISIISICLLLSQTSYANEKDELELISPSTSIDEIRIQNSILTEKRLLSAQSYDMRNSIEIRIKDQGSTNNCWAFSTISVLETTLAKTRGEYLDFSERHMNYATSRNFLDGVNELGYDREVYSGGNPMLGLSYMTSRTWTSTRK